MLPVIQMRTATRPTPNVPKYGMSAPKGHVLAKVDMKKAEQVAVSMTSVQTLIDILT